MDRQGKNPVSGAGASCNPFREHFGVVLRSRSVMFDHSVDDRFFIATEFRKVVEADRECSLLPSSKRNRGGDRIRQASAHRAVDGNAVRFGLVGLLCPRNSARASKKHCAGRRRTVVFASKTVFHGGPLDTGHKAGKVRLTPIW